MTNFKLEAPLKYFPPKNGKYEVSAGLRSLDIEKPGRENSIFQIDEHYLRYIKNIQAARQENLSKYNPPFVGLKDEELFAVNEYIMDRLLKEYPGFFELVEGDKGESIFYNKLNEEKINFNKKGNLISSTTAGSCPYRDLWDALASQVQADLSIWKMDSQSQKEWLAALHLTSPSHWAAEDKIGKGFVEVHMPVAGIEPINARFWQFVQMICQKGPFERSVWSLATDNRLNHHPEAPPGVDPKEWNGRRFDLDNPQLYLRVERQTLSPFPEFEASFFTIRVYFYEVTSLDKEEISKLISAIESMTEASLVYKGLKEEKSSVIKYLESLL